ncbi:MAG: WYL domain-containing protein, partial [Clostridia bacterium]
REKVQELKVPIVNLQLQIDKDLGYRVYDEFDKKDIKITEKGDYLISVSYPEDEWVYGYLLSFGEKIKIQKPEAVREKLQEKIKKMSERINEK